MIREIIAKELARKGESLYWLAKQSGVPYPRVHDFLVSGKEIRTGTLEKLMVTLKLELRRRK
jgi:hypothetical protein